MKNIREDWMPELDDMTFEDELAFDAVQDYDMSEDDFSELTGDVEEGDGWSPDDLEDYDLEEDNDLDEFDNLDDYELNEEDFDTDLDDDWDDDIDPLGLSESVNDKNKRLRECGEYDELFETKIWTELENLGINRDEAEEAFSELCDENNPYYVNESMVLDRLNDW